MLESMEIPHSLLDVFNVLYLNGEGIAKVGNIHK